MSVTGLLTTTAGQAAIIADLAATAELVITHVAWGDANGAPYNPNPAQVALVNERYRAGIASVAVVAGALVIEAVIPADTPDATARPSHGFNVAEAAVFGTTGGVSVMLGIARMSNGFKPAPASGQAAIATFRFKLAVANPASIAVVIDPQAQLILGRNVRPFWVTVDGHLNNPPANPAQGATYCIGAAPTGAWAGFAGRLAQWVGVWSLATVPVGHIVADNSRAESDPLRYLKFIGGAWVSAAAAVDAYGLARRATDAEVAAAAVVNAYMTPGQRVIHGMAVFTASGNFVVPANVYRVWLQIWGGGPGGGGINASGNAGGGGGGAEYREGVEDVVPGATHAVTVGAAGLGGSNAGGNGGNGGASSFGALITAMGGLGGMGAPAGGYGGAGGTGGSGGQLAIPGNPGSNGTVLGGAYVGSGTGGGTFGMTQQYVQWLTGQGGTGFGYGTGGNGATGGTGPAQGGPGRPGLVIVRW